MQGPSGASRLQRLGSNWRTQKPLPNEKRKRFPEKHLGETAGHSPCPFSHRTRDSSPPPPRHTHTHTRRARALHADTTLTGWVPACPRAGGPGRRQRLQVRPAPPPGRTQHCRQGWRPAAQPWLSQGLCSFSCRQKEGAGEPGRRADLSRRPGVPGRPRRLQGSSSVCAQAGQHRRAYSARHLEWTSHRLAAADGPSSHAALGRQLQVLAWYQ